MTLPRIASATRSGVTRTRRSRFGFRLLRVRYVTCVTYRILSAPSLRAASSWWRSDVQGAISFSFVVPAFFLAVDIRLFVSLGGTL